MPAEFRLQGKYFFLTYARCDLSKEALLNHIQEILGDNLDKYVICREQHEDGGYHLHAVVTTHRRVSVRNPRYLDVEEHHPNVQVVRSIVAATRYVRKDGDTISNFEIIEEKPSWGDIRDAATSVEDYMQLVEKHYPRDTALNWDRLFNYATIKFKKATTPYVAEFPDTEWQLPNGITEWIFDEFEVSMASLALGRNLYKILSLALACPFTLSVPITIDVLKVYSLTESTTT